MTEGREPVLPHSLFGATFHQYLVGSPESPREVVASPHLIDKSTEVWGGQVTGPRLPGGI